METQCFFWGRKLNFYYLHEKLFYRVSFLVIFVIIIIIHSIGWVIEFPHTWKVIKEGMIFQGQSGSRFLSFWGHFHQFPSSESGFHSVLLCHRVSIGIWISAVSLAFVFWLFFSCWFNLYSPCILDIGRIQNPPGLECPTCRTVTAWAI